MHQSRLLGNSPAALLKSWKWVGKMAFVQSSACFVAIPRDPRFDSVRQVVAEALDESNVISVDIESQMPGSSVSNISETLERVDFVIADVTDEGSNTLYLLGVADGLRKPTLIMTQNRVPLPGDLARRQLLSYGPQEVSKLRDYLRYWIPDVMSLQLKRNAAVL
jgi:hypothetical protein